MGKKQKQPRTEEEIAALRAERATQSRTHFALGTFAHGGYKPDEKLPLHLARLGVADYHARYTVVDTRLPWRTLLVAEELRHRPRKEFQICLLYTSPSPRD